MSDADNATLESLPTIEQAVIGACLLDAAAATLALEHLRPEHFSHHSAQAAFRAIQREAPEGGKPDIAILIDGLSSDPNANGAARYVIKSVEYPTPANQPEYVRRVLKDWCEREEKSAGAMLGDAVSSEGRQIAHARLAAVEETRLKLTKPLGAQPSVPFQPIGAFDLLNLTLPMVEELVAPRILYRGGVTVLVASHKRGKSLAALGLCADLVLNIATPLEQLFDEDSCPRWLGQQVMGRGPVLVYSAEGGRRMLQERIRKLVPDARESLNDLRVYADKPTPQLDRAPDLDAVFAQAEAMGAVILVFDPLGRFWAMAEEGDPTAARNLMEGIQTHAEAAYAGRGIAVLVIHHDTKNAGADADSAVTGGRGSGKFGDDADALINLKIGGKGSPAGQSKVMFLLRHAESPAPVTVQIDHDTLRLRVLDEGEVIASAPKSGRPPKLSLDNLAKLVRRKKSIRADKIADELGVAFPTWNNNRKKMLTALVETGEFQVVVHPGSPAEFVETLSPS